MTTSSSADTDLEGLQRHLGEDVSMPYIDVDQQQRLTRALQRWPLLARLHALITAPSPADDRCD